jgi:hypothetical protein
VKAPELLTLLRAAGLSPRLGYKLKDGKGNDLLSFRTDGAGGWRDELRPAEDGISPGAVLAVLEAGAAAGCGVTVSACLCGRCFDEEVRAIHRDFTFCTGIPISHGYAAACLERVTAEMMA